MPARILRDGILCSRKVCSLKWDEEIFYRRLMSVVDDFGRFEFDLQLLRSRCYPLQVDQVRVADISRWSTACATAGLILDYVVDGKRYLQIVQFGQQERSKAKYPSPPVLKSFDINCNQVKSNAHLDVGVCVDEVVDEGVGESKQPPEAAVDDSIDFRSSWNALPEPFKKIVKWNTARQGAFKARMQDEVFRERWWDALQKLKDSAFLSGKNNRGWIADVDFFLTESGFTKILEGKYDNTKPVADKPSEEADPGEIAWQKMFGGGAKI